MAKQYHPDSKWATKLSEEQKRKFQDICEAYDVLANDTKRQHYDMYGVVQSQQTLELQQYLKRSDELISNVLSSDRQNYDIDVDGVAINLTFLEAIEGLKRTIGVPAKIKCEKCMQKGIFQTKRDDICQVCNGNGYHLINTTKGTVKKMCRFCEGSKIMYRITCSDCNGKGFTFQKQNLTVSVPPMSKNGDVVKIQIPGRVKPLEVVLRVEKRKLKQRLRM